jgi:hypothetical protein
MWKSRANNRAARYHSIVERKRLSAAFLQSCLMMRYHMPRRYQPAQLLAAIIIGIVVAVVILILYGRIWL